MSGLGIDLIEIARLEAALERHPRLVKRLFTDAEIAYATARARPGRHLAGRFAAKEAVVKALRMDGGFGLRDIEVTGSPPVVCLRGRAAEAAGGRQVVVSITHSRDLAAAAATVGAPQG